MFYVENTEDVMYRKGNTSVNPKLNVKKIPEQQQKHLAVILQKKFGIL